MSITRLEELKIAIDKERNTHAKSTLVYEALEVFIELQTDDTWRGMVNHRTGSVNATEIASKLGVSRNIWRKPIFADRLRELNLKLYSNGIISNTENNLSQEGLTHPLLDVNPIQEVREAKLRLKLQLMEEKLASAEFRIRELEKQLRV